MPKKFYKIGHRPYVIKPFWCNYNAVGINSVKIIGKYADSDGNYAKKVL